MKCETRPTKVFCKNLKKNDNNKVFLQVITMLVIYLQVNSLLHGIIRSLNVGVKFTIISESTLDSEWSNAFFFANAKLSVTRTLILCGKTGPKCVRYTGGWRSRSFCRRDRLFSLVHVHRGAIHSVSGNIFVYI